MEMDSRAELAESGGQAITALAEVCGKLAARECIGKRASDSGAKCQAAPLGAR